MPYKSPLIESFRKEAVVDHGFRSRRSANPTHCRSSGLAVGFALQRDLNPASHKLNGLGPTIFSTKLVSNRPRIKSAFRMIFCWNGIVVLIPVIRYSPSALLIRLIAACLVEPTQIN